MKGKNHEDINKALLPFIILLLILVLYLKYSIVYIFIIPPLFYIRYHIATYYVTPDIDTDSRARRRLGFIGFIIDMCFRHRTLLHSYKFWTVGFLLEYAIEEHFMVGFGLIAIGGYIPAITHLLSDRGKDVYIKLKRKVFH